MSTNLTPFYMDEHDAYIIEEALHQLEFQTLSLLGEADCEDREILIREARLAHELRTALNIQYKLFDSLDVPPQWENANPTGWDKIEV